MKTALRTLPLGAIAVALASPAVAQDQDATIVVTAQANNASQVRQGGQAGVLGDQLAENLPFSLRSYDESLILNQQPLSLGEVLENDPTIRTTYGFGNASEQFVIRGFQLFADDVGMNGLYGITPRQIVAPELYGSVQVLNGSSAFLNGAAPGGSGLGGSVNLQLKRAGRDLNRVTLGYVSQGHIGGSFDVSRRFGDNREWGVRVNGAYRDGEVAVDGEDRRAFVLGGAIDYDSGPLRVSLDLGYQDMRVDNLRPKVTLLSAAIPAVPDSDANYAQDYSYTDLEDVFGLASIEVDLSEGLTIYAKAGAREGDEEGIYGGIQVLDAATGEASSGFHSYIPFEASNQAVEAGLRAGFETGPLTHAVVAGGNMAWQEDRTAYDFFSAFPTNLYAVQQVPIQPSAFTGGDLDDPYPIAKRKIASLFVSDTIALLGDRVLVTGGLRWQKIEADGFSYFGGALISSYDEDKVTPVAGLVIKPVEGLSLYANRIEALQQGPTAPLDASLVNRGENLAPRTSTQYEIGGKLAVMPGLDASLALYRIERPGEGSFTNADGDLEFGYIGDQRHEGIELTLTGEVTPGLRVISGLAWTDATYDNGREVPGVPGFTANADVEWDVDFLPGFTLTGGMMHTGEQQANAANTLQLDDWTVFDVGARYVFVAAERPWTLRFGIDNLFDEAYWASAYDTFSSALLQGRPRTVTASISVEL